MPDAASVRRLAAVTLSQRGWLAAQPAKFRDTVLESLRLRRIQRGGSVYLRGDTADGLYAVVSGRIKFRSCTPDGREVVVGAAGAGSWFGEVGVFDGLPRLHDAIALNPSVVVVLPVERFRHLTSTEPRWLANFAEIMARNLRGISYVTLEVSPEPPTERVLRLLALLVHDDMEQAHGRAVVLDVAQNLLASLAGLSRQTVNRELRKLAAAGALECHYGRVVVDTAFLQRRAALSPVGPATTVDVVAARRRVPADSRVVRPA